MKLPKTRKYNFKSGTSSDESTNLWIFILIGLAIAAAIVFLL